MLPTRNQAIFYDDSDPTTQFNYLVFLYLKMVATKSQILINIYFTFFAYIDREY